MSSSSWYEHILCGGQHLQDERFVELVCASEIITARKTQHALCALLLKGIWPVHADFITRRCVTRVTVQFKPHDASTLNVALNSDFGNGDRCTNIVVT